MAVGDDRAGGAGDGGPARHWSGRTLSDRYERLWEGFVIEGARDTVYFAGDTGWGRMYRELHARWGRFTLALLPIAPFRPRWYMARKHLSPDNAVRAAMETRSAMVIPIHWGTFELGDDGEVSSGHVARCGVGASGAMPPAVGGAPQRGARRA